MSSQPGDETNMTELSAEQLKDLADLVFRLLQQELRVEGQRQRIPTKHTTHRRRSH